MLNFAKALAVTFVMGITAIAAPLVHAADEPIIVVL